ncbi:MULTISPECIES: hypothetical protein [Streptomyces]|nr:hypothetical protein [Streptomyces sp. CB00271]QNQ36795.1 hypothetical protein HYC88_26050 [Streptomyces sp. CB00271]
MESRSVDQFIYIGTAIRFMQDVQEGWDASGEGGVLENYESLLEWLSENGMHVSHRAAQIQLQGVIGEVEERVGEVVAEGGEERVARLTDEEAERISKGTNVLRETVLAETQGYESYVVTDKRYPVDTLLGKPERLMAPGVFQELPPIAQYDFKEAGRCIAFELPTAAAFHLMRGTEDVLKFFYCEMVKQKRATLMWGPMVKSLRLKKRNAPPSVLLTNLDSLRIEFRNPTQHPEKVYDIHEVQDLLSLSVDVVNRMVKHMGLA